MARTKETEFFFYNHHGNMSPGCVAQSVGHLTRARGPGFDTLSGNILPFLLPLIQEGQLSVTGESMCTKYCLSLPRKSVVRLTDCPDMTIAVYHGRKTTTKQHVKQHHINNTYTYP